MILKNLWTFSAAHFDEDDVHAIMPNVSTRNLRNLITFSSVHSDEDVIHPDAAPDRADDDLAKTTSIKNILQIAENMPFKFNKFYIIPLYHYTMYYTIISGLIEYRINYTV